MRLHPLKTFRKGKSSSQNVQKRKMIYSKRSERENHLFDSFKTEQRFSRQFNSQSCLIQQNEVMIKFQPSPSTLTVIRQDFVVFATLQ